MNPEEEAGANTRFEYGGWTFHKVRYIEETIVVDDYGLSHKHQNVSHRYIVTLASPWGVKLEVPLTLKQLKELVKQGEAYERHKRDNESREERERRAKDEYLRREAERARREAAEMAEKLRQAGERWRKQSATGGLFEEFFRSGNLFSDFSEAFTQQPPRPNTEQPKAPPYKPQSARPSSRASALDELTKLAGMDNRGSLTDKQLYRRAMARSHTDHGGSHEDAVRVNQLRDYLGIK